MVGGEGVAFRAENEWLKEKDKRLEEKNERLEEKGERLEEEVERLEEEVERLEEEVERLKEEVERLKEEVERLELRGSSGVGQVGGRVGLEIDGVNRVVVDSEEGEGKGYVGRGWEKRRS